MSTGVIFFIFILLGVLTVFQALLCCLELILGRFQVLLLFPIVLPLSFFFSSPPYVTATPFSTVPFLNLLSYMFTCFFSSAFPLWKCLLLFLHSQCLVSHPSLTLLSILLCVCFCLGPFTHQTCWHMWSSILNGWVLREYAVSCPLFFLSSDLVVDS